MTLAKETIHLQNLFSIVKEAIKDKAQERISNDEPINLIRRNIYGEYVPAYLNIDYLVERMELYRGLYFLPEKMKEALDKCHGYRIAKETRRCEDLDLFMRMYAMGYKGYNIQEKLYEYRIVNDAKKNIDQ